MANEQNLIPNSERSPKEVRENGRKGGIASGIARREKKTLREMMEVFGNLESPTEGMTNDELMILAQYRKAQDQKAMGSTEAAKFIRDTKGEAPNKNEISFNGIESITINFGKGK
jgi:hypothetical protein